MSGSLQSYSLSVMHKDPPINPGDMLDLEGPPRELTLIPSFALLGRPESQGEDRAPLEPQGL